MGAKAAPYSPAEVEWLRENYPAYGPRPGLAEAHRRDFPGGPERTFRALTMKAHNMRLYVTHRPDSRNRRPIGYERDTGKGYVIVKVAEDPTVPGSKDNWRPKQVVEWERANGPVPEGFMVMFGDRDYTNCDPSNLVLVEKNLIGPINTGAFGDYANADELRAVAANAKLRVAVVDAMCRPRPCALCGELFTPKRANGGETTTCPKCIAEGHKNTWNTRKSHGTGICAVCGAEFEKKAGNARRCPECIRRKPKHSAEQQRASERRG